MSHLTWVQLLVSCILIVSVTCVREKHNAARKHKSAASLKDNKSGTKEQENNPDVLKEFRSFADSVIPEDSHYQFIPKKSSGGARSNHIHNKDVLTKHFKNITTIKDPTHPYALYINGPSVSQTPQNITVSYVGTVGKDIGTVRKDAAPKYANLLSKPVNETSLQRNYSEKQVATFTRAPESAESELEKFEFGLNGDNADPLKLTKDNKDGASVIAEALATATNDLPEPISNYLSTIEQTSAPPATASVPEKKKPRKGSKLPTKNSTVIAKPSPESHNATKYPVNEKTEKPSETLISYKGDDEVDTYVDEKEEKPRKMVKTNAVKKKPSTHKVQGSNKKLSLKEYRSPLRPTKHPKDVRNSSKNHVLKDHRNSLRPLKHQMGGSASKVKSPVKNLRYVYKKPRPIQFKHNIGKSRNDAKRKTSPITKVPKALANESVARTNVSQEGINDIGCKFNDLPKGASAKRMPAPITKVPKALADAAITQADLTQAGTTWTSNDIGCKFNDLPKGVKQPIFGSPAPVCMATCSEACAPSCTPQCCALETAPPPVKEAEPPPKERMVRWMERAQYEPGPNYPPPPAPPLIRKMLRCAIGCNKSCAPACLPACCYPPPPPPVIGCSRQCTPRMCIWGCPAHCCARYVKKADIMLPSGAYKTA